MRQYLFIGFIFLFTSAVFAQEAKNEINFNIEENNKKPDVQPYKFSVTYRLNVGYLQEWQHSLDTSFPEQHLYGPQLGVTFDFNLPYYFSIQTGLFYQISYGQNSQHWKNINTSDYSEQSIKHRVLSHNLAIPVRATIYIKLWKKLSLMFYTGPQLVIGIAQTDYMKTNLNDETKAWLKSKDVHTEKYDRFSSHELIRPNIQYGIGLGLQWDKYSVYGGYDFGLNNLVKQNTEIHQHMWNWTWHVSFAYAF